MKNSEKIIERLKKLLNLDNDTKLSKYLEINQSTLATWKKSDTFDIYRIHDKLLNKKININWLLTGEGYPYLDDIQILKNRIKELEELIKKMEYDEGKNKIDTNIRNEIDELHFQLSTVMNILKELQLQP